MKPCLGPGMFEHVVLLSMHWRNMKKHIGVKLPGRRREANEKVGLWWDMMVLFFGCIDTTRNCPGSKERACQYTGPVIEWRQAKRIQAQTGARRTHQQNSGCTLDHGLIPVPKRHLYIPTVISGRIRNVYVSVTVRLGGREWTHV